MLLALFIKLMIYQMIYQTNKKIFLNLIEIIISV